MDKNAIKKYAVWARNELIEKVTQKAQQYGIEDGKIMDPNASSVNGIVLSDTQKKQRKALIEKVDQDGFTQVMEEVAYTWFNRFIALRFMEVNGYLPSHVRVFTDEDNNFKPQILSEAIHLDIDGLDMEKVYAMKEANQDEELFKYLLITQCNALNSILPGMFQKIADYTELLLPDYLLREGSVIEQMITMIPEEDWTDQVQIIGWLYQYYNSEPKDQVFADLKKNKKITKEKIPAATQLFTPDWIVRYMVENSLGRLWLEGHPSNKDKFLPTKEEQNKYIETHEDDGKWHYYLEEAKQEPEVQKQLDKIHKEYSALKPEDILCIDPCQGSGHILCYLFDTLVKIYEDYGYSSRDAASKIVENNIWGLDIDERASQLAYFSIMMKARQYDRRFFTRHVQPHIYAIQESNHIDPEAVKYFENGNVNLKEAMDSIISELHDAKEYGSILNVTPVDFDALNHRITECENDISFHKDAVKNEIAPLIHVAQALAQKYHVVVTNPPYMGGSGMSAQLSSFVKKNYPDSKSDLFAVFIERCSQMVGQNYFQAMITQHAWMFLSSFEKLRTKILNKTIVNMAHLGARAFEEISGEVVQTASFVLFKCCIEKYKGVYCRLIEPTTQQGKEELYLSGDVRYESAQENFSKIPGSPVAYWTNDNILKCYNSKTIYDFAHPCKGIDTGDNNIFLRFWHEVTSNQRFQPDGKKPDELDFKEKRWFPYNKGGDYRKWYGNNLYVLDWSDHGEKLKCFKKSNLRNKEYYFREGITWSTVTSGNSSFRYFQPGYLFDNGGSCLFTSFDLAYIQGFLNSVVSRTFLSMQPTINTQPGSIGELPLLGTSNKEVHNIDCIVQRCRELSKSDWDSFETSWDFYKNPLIRETSKVETAYTQLQSDCEYRFMQLKANEEELNRIFIGIYGLDDELSPEVLEYDITIQRIFDAKADIPQSMYRSVQDGDSQKNSTLSRYAYTKQDVIKSFISYAVGCMFGRYSLDVDGLAYAGGDWDASKYKTFIPDKDDIIPITDDEYFTDDIVGRFVEFVKVVYGAETLEENLKFIAEALGGKGTPREVIRNYFLNDFYKDHCKTYQKRPIYWLFDSGKKNGFKCLIYMHRYQPDTIARIRTDYVHEQQSRYRTAIEENDKRLQSAEGSNKVKLSKQLKKLRDQDEELHAYEEKIHHLADQMISIDLDDGVKHNYAIFQDVLAKIK